MVSVVVMSSEPPPSTPPDLEQPDDTLDAVAAVSLRLMAGAVPKRTMQDLKRTVEQSPSEYPWQVTTKVILAVDTDPQQLVQQGLRAQRDWILRGGRKDPGKSGSVKAKTFAAKLLTQAIFFGVFSVLAIVMLLLIKHKWPDANIYGLLDWAYGAFPSLSPK